MAPDAVASQADPMSIGIIGGTGPAGSGLAVRLAAAGQPVLLGSRDLDKAKQRVDELRERWGDRVDTLDAATNHDAAATDLVVLATVADSVVATAAEHAAVLGGRVVVSMANLLTRSPRGFAAVLPDGGSVAIEVQRAVPDARVVGAFQNLPAKALGELDHPLHADVVVCGDDAEAVTIVLSVIASIEGLEPVDGGPLINAAAVEALTAVLLTVNRTRHAEHGVHIVELRRFR
jgi:NADPH-dependent F420 reductase